MNLWTRFSVAFQGIWFFITVDRGKLHLVAAVLSLLAAIVLHFTLTEWFVVLFCIAGVFASEMLNTAIEKLCDLVQPDYDVRIKHIKDVSAGAVLVMSAISVIAFAIILISKMS